MVKIPADFQTQFWFFLEYITSCVQAINEVMAIYTAVVLLYVSKHTFALALSLRQFNTR